MIFWLIVEPLLAIYYLIDLGFYSISLSFAIGILAMLCWVIVFSIYQRAVELNRNMEKYGPLLIQNQIKKQQLNEEMSLAVRKVKSVQNIVPNLMQVNSTFSVQNAQNQ